MRRACPHNIPASRRLRRLIDEAVALSPPANSAPPAGDVPVPDQVFAPGAPLPAAQTLPTPLAPKRPAHRHGRRSQSVAIGQSGQAIGAAPPDHGLGDIALAATLRAAALRRSGMRRGGEEARRRDERSITGEERQDWMAPEIELLQRSDLRVKVRRARTGNLILFVVDASGSMGARKRMVAVKGAVLSLLLDAYQKRDRVGLITFRGQGAKVLVPPTNSVELAERSLRQMPTGGQTPLAAGLLLAGQTLALHLKREAALTPLLVLVTDGRANIELTGQLHQAVRALLQMQPAGLILDSEQGYVRLGIAQELARRLGANYVHLDDLRSDTIAQRIRQQLPPY